MDFGDILISEISQMEKDKYHMISLICEILKNKIKQKQTHRYKDQISNFYQRGRWLEVGKMGE